MNDEPSDWTLNEFFEGRPISRQIFERILQEVETIGATEMRISKSQIAFRRKRNVAVVWIPGRYLRDRPTVPLVLTFSFQKPDPSPRWKEVRAVSPRRFTHHLELYKASDVDTEVRNWLQAAWNAAG